MAIKGSNRGVRRILIGVVRVVLVLAFVLALYEGRRLLLLTAIAAFFISFLPNIYSYLFKKESASLFDMLIIFFIFGLFYYWEIQGVYSNYWAVSYVMLFAEAVALGFLGLTVVYSFFKSARLEANSLVISVFALCFSFSLGTMIELFETAFDSIFKFNIHKAGVFGIAGDLVLYFSGSFLVCFAGYFSIKKGKPLLVSKYIENAVAKNLKFFGLLTPMAMNAGADILSLIKNGEGKNVEFKSTLRKNLHTNLVDRQIEHSVLKTINAYLNSDGGTLLIGVNDKGEVVGLDNDQFATDDHAHRHLMQLINDHLGAEFLTLVQASVAKVDGKSLLVVECKKSNRESFLKNGKDENFYVRQGSLSQPLTGSSLLKYIEGNFRKRE
jgi:hypothetical protein